MMDEDNGVTVKPSESTIVENENISNQLHEVPLKKRTSNWIHAEVKAYKNDINQEPSNLGNQHDFRNSNARLESTTITSDIVRDIAGPSTQICRDDMDEVEKERERRRRKHRRTVRKSRLRAKKICKELEEQADMLRREISYLRRTIDFYSRESLKTRKKNKGLLEELKVLYRPEDFAVILAENPDQDPPSSDDENDEGGY